MFAGFGLVLKRDANGNQAAIWSPAPAARRVHRRDKQRKKDVPISRELAGATALVDGYKTSKIIP
jgi:hypothetical protein